MSNGYFDATISFEESTGDQVYQVYPTIESAGGSGQSAGRKSETPKTVCTINQAGIHKLVAKEKYIDAKNQKQIYKPAIRQVSR